MKFDDLISGFIRLHVLHPAAEHAALAEFGDAIGGTTLQVGCAYGDLTNRLCSAVTDGGGEIDIVDVLPIQLGNLKSKLPAIAPVRLLAMDSSSLRLPDASYDRALVFFLLHEQPDRYRELTLSEVFPCPPQAFRTRRVTQGDQSLVPPRLHAAN